MLGLNLFLNAGTSFEDRRFVVRYALLFRIDAAKTTMSRLAFRIKG